MPPKLPFLDKRLLVASPSELLVLRDALKPHQATLVPKLWSVLDSAQPGDVSLLPAASALADYDADSPRWESVGGKVTQALIRVNPVFLGAWLDALRPVRTPITTSLGAIFRNAANLLMDADPKTYVACFPIAQYHEPLTSPLLQAEIARKLTFSWNDPPLDPSWTTPDPTLTGKIESAQGMLTERFAFCQTMPLDEFVKVAEALRKSGYRPIRLPSLRRWQEPPGGCGLDPRWASLANGSRSDRRRDSQDRRAEPQGGIPSGRCRRILGCGWGGGQAHLPLRRPVGAENRTR